MGKNDNLTLNSGMIAFKKSNIDAVVAEIEAEGSFELSTPPEHPANYNVMTVLDGKKIGIANMMQTGERYVTSFGIIPSRDYENDDKTRQEAESRIDYLRKVFSKYAK
jgi:hypothetical protein